MEYIKHMKGIPACEKCGIPIRPGLFFFGEMTDPHLISQASQAIHDAQVLLLLGTTLNSEVFAHYIKYFHGKWLIMIHKERHFLDDNADMVFIDQPKIFFPSWDIVSKSERRSEERFFSYREIRQS